MFVDNIKEIHFIKAYEKEVVVVGTHAVNGGAEVDGTDEYFIAKVPVTFMTGVEEMAEAIINDPNNEDFLVEIDLREKDSM